MEEKEEEIQLYQIIDINKTKDQATRTWTTDPQITLWEPWFSSWIESSSL